jgi:hypothetical protein
MVVAPSGLPHPLALPLAIDTGGLGGWLVILLVTPGLVVLLAVMTALLLRRRRDADAGPGYYHVLGVDPATQARRELTVRADSPQAARGRAQMDGIVVTEVRRVQE